MDHSGYDSDVAFIALEFTRCSKIAIRFLIYPNPYFYANIYCHSNEYFHIYLDPFTNHDKYYYTVSNPYIYSYIVPNAHRYGYTRTNRNPHTNNFADNNGYCYALTNLDVDAISDPNLYSCST